MLATRTHLTKDDMKNGRMLTHRLQGIIKKPSPRKERFGKNSARSREEEVMIFKATAMGDQVFIEAKDAREAKDKLLTFTGPLPSGLVTLVEHKGPLPPNEECIADMRR